LFFYPDFKMPLKTESELRRAKIDRLIAASLSESKKARETNLEQWRAIGIRKIQPDSLSPKAG
jgi:hypothetical protein